MGAWASGAAVPILCYHAVDDDQHDRTISPRAFEQHMEWLVRVATPIDLRTLERLLLGERSITRPVVVTFDDGYASVFDAAFPVLERLGIPFAIFPTTGHVGGEQTLRGRSKSLVSWHQLRGMLDSGLLTVGCHTHRHDTAVPLDPEMLGKDIEVSLSTLDEHLGVRARTFAFPKGRFDDATLASVQPRFDLTFAGEGLQAVPGCQGQPLRRIGVTRNFSRLRLQASFSPRYWAARQVRSRHAPRPRR
jgi:peptidoglycan/xylan/chitin deacetylase (PgdA/CDA1 family)